MSELLAGLPDLAASHLGITLVALSAGIAVSIPLALLARRLPRLRTPIITLAGLIQTIPGLALLALMVPLLASSDGLGLGIPAFGFAPAVIALTLYALLPILRNAITGIESVDAAVVEAARGMGMSERQVLWQVQLPLAAPVIAAGIRTAAVWTVGAATLATPVGQSCLGNYIFAGLQTKNWPMVLTGVAGAAALALLLELGLGLLQRAIARRRRGHTLPTAGALALVLGVLLGLPSWVEAPAPAVEPDRAATGAAEPAERAPSEATVVRIGGKTFTEQYILMEAMRLLLERRGVGAELVESLGSTIVFDALGQGDVDVYVDYSGTLWATQMKRERVARPWVVRAEIDAWLSREHRIRDLGPLGFENAYALAVTRETADRLELETIADLAEHAPQMAMGSDYEFFARREWTRLRETYGLRFERRTSYDPVLMIDALMRREVDVITAFSSDGRIAAFDLVVLDDPRAALPPYEALLLVGPRLADDRRVTCVLGALVGEIPVAIMRQANLMVDRDEDKHTPVEAARWLLEAAQVTIAGCRPKG